MFVCVCFTDPLEILLKGSCGLVGDSEILIVWEERSLEELVHFILAVPVILSAYIHNDSKVVPPLLFRDRPYILLDDHDCWIPYLLDSVVDLRAGVQESFV